MDQEFITETPAMKEAALREMKRRMQASTQHKDTMQQVLKRPDCDAFLLRFIRARKFDDERAFKNLLAFIAFTFQYNMVYSDLTCKLCDPEMKSVLDLGMHEFPGPKVVDKLGRQIIIVRPDRSEPWNYKPEQVMRALYFVFDKALDFEHTQSRGIALVGFNPENDIKRMDRGLMKLMNQAMTGALPLRLGAILMFRPSTIMNIVLPIMKAIMSAKLISRIYMCKDEAALQEFMPASSLPDFAGGPVVSTHAALVAHYSSIYTQQYGGGKPAPQPAQREGYAAESNYSAPAPAPTPAKAAVYAPPAGAWD